MFRGTVAAQDLDEGDPSVLEPFQKMLQFALEPLLLYTDPMTDHSGQCLLYFTACPTASAAACFTTSALPLTKMIHAIVVYVGKPS